MVTSGVVWCLKDDKWVPLQLSSIRLHGVLTQAHWAAVSKFLQQVANKQFILQDNGFTELTDQQKELLLQNTSIGKTNEEDSKSSSEQWQNFMAKENGLIEALNGKTEADPASVSNSDVFTLNFNRQTSTESQNSSTKDDLSTNSNVDRNNCNLFIDNLLQETDNNNVNVIGRFTVEQNEQLPGDAVLKKTDRKNSVQSDELVLRLLKKYSKYSRGALDDDILTAIDSFTDDYNSKQVLRSRKMSVVQREERLYENCNEFLKPNFLEDNMENERNEHLLRWLNQQSKHWNHSELTTRKLSLPSPDNKANLTSPTDRRKSCIAFKSHSRKSSLSSVFESKQSNFSPFAVGSRKSSINSSPNSRKSSVSSPSTSDSGKFSDFECRKNSVTSNSSWSESEESGTLASHWQKILKRHLGSKKLQKQREAWARNTRRLSLTSEPVDLSSQS